MSLRFWALAAVYHGVLVVVCTVRARAWLRRDFATLGGARFGRALAGDALACGVTAVVMAFLVAPALPDPAFAVMRFWSQALFGEVLVFLVFLSVLHWRRRVVPRSAVLAGAGFVLLTWPRAGSTNSDRSASTCPGAWAWSGAALPRSGSSALPRSAS